jgi:hypothetical protein
MIIMIMNDMTKIFIYFHDQEPLVLDLYQETLDMVFQRNVKWDQYTEWTLPGVIVVSETDSDNLDYICKLHNLQPFYYFFHGWAALDWYRGYDRTFLIAPWTER